MAREPRVVGAFDEPAAAALAIEALRGAGFRVTAAMPAAFPAVSAALGKPRSGIDAVTLPGALAGLLGGALLTVGGALAWPIVTGGKPIVSLPPFVVVIFEVTVLVGSLTNLVAMSVGSRRGGREGAFPRGVRLASGRVGVCAAGGDPAVAERILRERGGEEVGREG